MASVFSLFLVIVPAALVEILNFLVIIALRIFFNGGIKNALTGINAKVIIAAFFAGILAYFMVFDLLEKSRLKPWWGWLLRVLIYGLLAGAAVML